MGATDGDIGKVEDFYFDDETWTVRYLIVKTGSWLLGRKVLISTHALSASPREAGTFPVGLTMDQVRLSPDIDTEKPVSRRQEEQLSQYYPWTSYWGPGYYPGGVVGIMGATPRLTSRVVWETDNAKVSPEEQHLRSTRQVTGYHIYASDGEIGHVSDFILDDETWQLSYLIVDTHNWLGGKKVLVAVNHIKLVQWEDANVVVDITVDAIKNSAAADTLNYLVPESDNTDYFFPDHHKISQ